MTQAAVLASGCVERVWDAGRILGEGAWWSVAQQALYWVDISDPAILRLKPSTGERRIWPMPEPIGCCAPTEGDTLIAGMASGIYGVCLPECSEMAMLFPIHRPKGLGPGDRVNDGKCHPDGSFWAGTMDDGEAEVRGHFYRLDPDGRCTQIAGPFLVCNGPAFSPDGTIAYLADSADRTVWRMDLVHAATPEPFLHFGEEDGCPDGMTTDANGNLWIAFWDGARVACFSPSGKMRLVIPTPAARPTSCTFGGPDLKTLYITSARASESGRFADPGGDLYMVEIEGVRGWPACRYAARLGHG